MSKFQVIILAVFVVCIIAGVVSFALYKGNSSNSSLPTITIWGTFPANEFDTYVSAINNVLPQRISVNYVEHDQDTFTFDFVNALAVGRGPDVILISADMILPQKNKIIPIPYEVLPERVFMDSYVQDAEIYLSRNGILAVPFIIDPMIMYWNRSTFNSAGVASYPLYWDEFTGTKQNPGLIQKLTIKDDSNNIRKATLAMGDFYNITNARELLGSLLLQSGNPVTFTKEDGSVTSALKTSVSVLPTAALDFFSQLANPSNGNYSWNRGMPNDKVAFLSGNLATYFGFASELADIRNKNPNLNFDAAPMPQMRTGGMKATYGKIYGFSLVSSSPNAEVAYGVISTITSPQYLADLSKSLYLPSVRKDIISAGTNDPYISIFNQSALISRTWLDASPAESRQLMGSLVQSIVSGQKNVDQAIRDAGSQYDVILNRATQ